MHSAASTHDYHEYGLPKIDLGSLPIGLENDDQPANRADQVDRYFDICYENLPRPE